MTSILVHLVSIKDSLDEGKPVDGQIVPAFQMNSQLCWICCSLRRSSSLTRDNVVSDNPLLCSHLGTILISYASQLENEF